jgi:hypothetical protein
MASPKRSPNSHELKKRKFPHIARLRRDEIFRSADAAELDAAADRIAGGSDAWYSWAGWAPADVGYRLIGFATQDQADEMQCWIAASGIETRPAPGRYDGAQLGVAGVDPS